MKTKFNVGQTVILKHGDCSENGDVVIITKVVSNADSIPREEIGLYDIDLSCYTEKQKNKPFYKGEWLGDECWFGECSFKNNK